MKRTLFSAVLAVAVLVFVGSGWAAVVKGTLTKIDGANYLVKDDKGAEHKIHFDNTTKKTGEVKEGAKVEVDEDKGHAKSITVAGAK